MKSKILNINSLLLSPIELPLSNSIDKKTTIRTTASQTAFVEAVQAALPGGASFNDAISVIIDTVAHFSCHPTPDHAIGKARLLNLFHQHRIPEIHINRILELLEIPKASVAALSNGELFAEHVDQLQALKIADFFTVSHAYINGTDPSPYVTPVVRSKEDLSGVLTVSHDNLPALQPQFTLLIFASEESGCNESIAYLKVDRSLDMNFLFTTYQNIGRFVGNSVSLIDTDLVEHLKENHIRRFNLKCTKSELERLKKGGFLSI